MSRWSSLRSHLGLGSRAAPCLQRPAGMQADFMLPGGDLTRLAALMKDAESALPDRRTAETWENVRECIWMASSCAPLGARLAPTRAATALALAEIPGVPQDGGEVRCVVSQRDGWQTLAMNPALHVEEMFTAADALMSLIPLVRRAGLEELHDWAGNCTAGDVGCAPAAAGFALRRTKTAYPPLSAVVRRCPPLSAAETDTLRDVRRCPRKRRICSLRILNPCSRLSADDETLRICEKTLVRDVRDVRRSKMSDFLFVRGLSRTFADLWLFCFRWSCLWICLSVVALTCDRCSFALAQPRPRRTPSEMAGADAPASAADCLCRCVATSSDWTKAARDLHRRLNVTSAWRSTSSCGATSVNTQTNSEASPRRSSRISSRAFAATMRMGEELRGRLCERP